MASPRVIGTEIIEDARQRGRLDFEIFPNDIVTALAREAAERLGIRLIDGPLERPHVPRTCGASAIQRGLYRHSPKWSAQSQTVRRHAKRFSKIAFIGAGGVGGNVAHLATMHDLADELALTDIAPGVAAALAMDLNHASGITGGGVRCVGGESLDIVANADVVVVTAGQARTPSMNRADLINVNSRVIRQSAEAIRTLASQSIVIVVTNPLDEMTMEMLRATNFPRERVLGMAGTLDSSRFRNALATAAGVAPADVSAITLGSHGDEMVPITSLAQIKGRALSVFLNKEQVDACAKDAVTGGGQVVALKKSGSATVAPAHATLELLDHIRGARIGPVPVSVMLTGEYGIDGVVLGVPAHLGLGGLVKIEILSLSEEEQTLLNASAEAIQKRSNL